MTTIAAAMLALLVAGAGERLSPSALDAAALEIARVCDEPAPPPTGAECARALVVLWALESGAPQGPLFSSPSSGRFGCGPLQVLALEGWTPPCEVMRGDLGAGLAAGLVIYRAKLVRVGWHRRRALAAYNGAAHRESYGRRGERLARALAVAQ